jgi:hypothetical protein
MKHFSSAAPALTLTLALAAGAHAQTHAPRDPFARPAPPPAPAEAEAEAEAAGAEPATPALQPQLRAILYAPTRPLVNISGQILTVGERFGDYQVARIRERSITLVRNGVKSELGLDEAGGK